MKPQFSILDASDTVQIVSDVAGDSDKGIAKQMQWQISSWKNAMITPEEAAQLADNEIASVAARLYKEYERTLRAYQAVDFDDLISLPVRLFDEHPEVRERWQNKLRYLLVDEYQDTNRAQYRLLKLLSGVRGAFTAVGDDDQAIYAWRGADVENLKLLQQDYPKLKVIKLEQNYRSSRRILEAANTVIANNEKLFDKRLWSEHGQGEQIVVTNCRDAEHEAEWVATKIVAHKFEHRTRFKDYAILYRGNHQARLIEQQLRNHRIPYVMSGGQSFFDKAEIRDLIAWLRLLVNEDDDLAFIRAITTPRRGIGAATIEALGAYAGHRHSSLFAAVFEEGLTQHLNAKQLQGVQEFAAYINRLQYRAPREPAAQLLEDLLGAIRYEAWLFEHCDTREAESKWSNVRDFVGWLGQEGRGGRQEPARAHPDHRADVHARQGRPRLRRRADGDPARLQGAGVSARVPGRRRGGPAAAPEQHRRGQGRGRAPADVRRHHPRPAQPQPHLVRAAQVGQGVPPLRAEPLHRRDGRRHPHERPQDRAAGDEGRGQGAAGQPDGDVREPRQGFVFARAAVNADRTRSCVVGQPLLRARRIAHLFGLTAAGGGGAAS